jgi:hypothetical protein
MHREESDLVRRVGRSGRIDRRAAAAFFALASCGLAACGPPEDECSTDGKEWCVKNTPHRCVGESYQDWDDPESESSYLKVEGGIRCEVYGATCYEASETSAYCAFLDKSCASSTPSICVYDVIAECTEHAYPTPVQDCADDGMVCSTDGPGLGAECVNP